MFFSKTQSYFQITFSILPVMVKYISVSKGGKPNNNIFTIYPKCFIIVYFNHLMGPVGCDVCYFTTGFFNN